LGDSISSVIVPDAYTLIVQNNFLAVTAMNSDYFFNLQVNLMDPDLQRAGAIPVVVETSFLPESSSVYPDAPLHGLIGQTWRNVVYDGGVMYEGEIDDYVIISHQLFDPVFPYSRFAE